MLKKKMSDVSEQIRGVSYKPEDILSGPGENAIGILRANNIADGAVNFDDLVYVKKSKVSQKQMLRKGDILICTSSGSKNLVGKAAQIEEDCNYSFGAFCKVIRPQKINPGFLGMYFQSSLYRQYISEVSQGANINNIKNVHIDAIEIEGYSENEQKKIAELLERIVKIIKIRKQQISVLDTLIKSRFIEMFGNFVYERDRWNVCKIGDVADTIDPQPSHRTPPISPDGIPYVGIAECNYRTRRIDFEKARKVGQNVLREHTERYTLDEGDFIIGKIGTIGKPFFIPTEQTYTLSANIVLIKPIKGKVVPQYLYAVFQSEYMDRIIDAEKKSTSQPAFGIQKVRRIEIPMPPLELQQQFATFAAQTDKSKVAVQSALDKAQLLFDSLMQKYFG